MCRTCFAYAAAGLPALLAKSGQSPMRTADTLSSSMQRFCLRAEGVCGYRRRKLYPLVGHEQGHAHHE